MLKILQSIPTICGIPKSINSNGIPSTQYFHVCLPHRATFSNQNRVWKCVRLVVHFPNLSICQDHSIHQSALSLFCFPMSLSFSIFLSLSLFLAVSLAIFVVVELLMPYPPYQWNLKQNVSFVCWSDASHRSRLISSTLFIRLVNACNTYALSKMQPI